MLSRARRVGTTAIGLMLLLMIVGAASASASHLKGGTLVSSVSPSGVLEGKIVAFQREEPCDVESHETEDYELEVIAPDGVTKLEDSLETTLTRCLGITTGVFEGTFSIPLNNAEGPFGENAPSGMYTVRASNCCRVSGIMNTTESSFSLTDTVKNTPGATTSTPRFLSLTSVGAAIGYRYVGDVSATDPSGGGLSYSLLQAENALGENYDPQAPEHNVVTLAGSKVEVPAETTSGWTAGEYFVYKVRASNAEAEAAELDLLVKVTSNRPPTLVAPEEVTVTAGSTLDVPLSASDPDEEEVTIAPGSTPEWGTTAVTNGVAATGTLTLAPPAGTEGTYYASFDATDSNPDISLSDSKVIAIHVRSPEAPKTEAPPVAAAAATLPSAAPLPIMAPLAPAATPVSPECFSGRVFTIHWAIPKDRQTGAVWLRIGDDARKRLGRHVRQAKIDLRGEPAGAVKVSVSTRTRSGRKIRSVRVFHTCKSHLEVAPIGNLTLR